MYRVTYSLDNNPQYPNWSHIIEVFEGIDAVTAYLEKMDRTWLRWRSYTVEEVTLIRERKVGEV